MMDVQALIAAGGLVELPEGEFEISRPLAPPKGRPLALIGKGPTRTVLKVTAPMPAVITLAGAPKPDGVVQNVSYWDLCNLTFDGRGQDTTALQLNCATQGRIDRVVFLNFAGSAIDATQWWDSTVTDTQIVRCGNVGRQQPGVRLRNGLRKGEQCNNLTWLGGRFESNPWVSLWIGAADSDGPDYRAPGRRCRVNHFLTKFHSTLPTATPYDHVWLQSTDDNTISGNITHCGGSGIVQKDCSDNAFPGLHLGNCDRAGMEIISCPRWSVEGIVWSTVGGKNQINYTVR